MLRLRNLYLFYYLEFLMMPRYYLNYRNNHFHQFTFLSIQESEAVSVNLFIHFDIS